MKYYTFIMEKEILNIAQGIKTDKDYAGTLEGMHEQYAEGEIATLFNLLTELLRYDIIIK